MEHKEPHSRAESHVCAWVGRGEEKRRMLTHLPLLSFSWETTLHPACLTPRCSRDIHCAYRDPVAYFSCETNGIRSLAILASALSPYFPESVLLFILVESIYPVLPNSDKLAEENVIPGLESNRGQGRDGLWFGSSQRRESRHDQLNESMTTKFNGFLESAQGYLIPNGSNK